MAFVDRDSQIQIQIQIQSVRDPLSIGIFLLRGLEALYSITTPSFLSIGILQKVEEPFPEIGHWSIGHKGFNL